VSGCLIDVSAGLAITTQGIFLGPVPDVVITCGLSGIWINW